ncbi:MAG TPA: MFS transporter [Xanthobacteraceae bacterium]|nr:MFS transporter [Xanthobacteraceae bacterium]
MSSQHASAITARLDRLPLSRHIWVLVVLLSLGGWFELYDLLMTGYVSPGLIRAGIFSANEGLFGLPDQAAFASVTFAGLFVGTILFAQVADRFGRRAIFTFALLWYALATAVMAAQSTRFGVNLWRFIAGVGVGVELVTIDAYIAELVPKAVRGRVFAINQAIQFSSAPVVAGLSALLINMDPLGLAGWRWIALVPAVGAVLVWWIRRAVPESPRWLAQHRRAEEAETVIAAIEAKVVAETGQPLPQPGPGVAESGGAGFGEIWQPPYRSRTIMLSVFNFFQTIGFYGFGNWVPALIAAQGVTFTKGPVYAAIIAIVYPFGPLLCSLIADQIERKWQIVGAACGTAIFGLLFWRSGDEVPLLILFGVLITTSNNLLSYAYHAYQAELFPTRVRARAVGFVYSFSRLSTVFTSFMIGFFLQNFGNGGVFGFIAFAMVVVMISIGVFGPRTSGRALEEISAAAPQAAGAR